jgi:hypothetical protein
VEWLKVKALSSNPSIIITMYTHINKYKNDKIKLILKKEKKVGKMANGKF